MRPAKLRFVDPLRQPINALARVSVGQSPNAREYSCDAGAECDLTFAVPLGETEVRYSVSADAFSTTQCRYSSAESASLCELNPRLTISGHVVDAETGATIPTAEVTDYRQPARKTVPTASGFFTNVPLTTMVVEAPTQGPRTTTSGGGTLPPVVQGMLLVEAAGFLPMMSPIAYKSGVHNYTTSIALTRLKTHALAPGNNETPEFPFAVTLNPVACSTYKIRVRDVKAKGLTLRFVQINPAFSPGMMLTSGQTQSLRSGGMFFVEVGTQAEGGPFRQVSMADMQVFVVVEKPANLPTPASYSLDKDGRWEATLATSEATTITFPITPLPSVRLAYRNIDQAIRETVCVTGKLLRNACSGDRVQMVNVAGDFSVFDTLNRDGEFLLTVPVREPLRLFFGDFEAKLANSAFSAQSGCVPLKVDVPTCQRNQDATESLESKTETVAELLFEKDRFDLSPDAEKTIAAALERNKGNLEYVEVVGHTCEQGAAEHNEILGRERAEETAERLRRKFNIAPEQVRASSRGQRNPKWKRESPDKADEEVDKKNRRAEIRIVRTTTKASALRAKTLSSATNHCAGRLAARRWLDQSFIVYALNKEEAAAEAMRVFMHKSKLTQEEAERQVVLSIDFNASTGKASATVRSR